MLKDQLDITPRRQSLSDIENFEERLGARSHILMNGKTVLEYGETPDRPRRYIKEREK